MNTKQLPTMVDENGSKAVATRTTGPSNTFLVPTNMSDAMRLAELMAGSLLIPRDFQKKPSDCLMVIMQAVRWQMDPFAVIQKCSVIQGKLMYEGQLVAAVINTRGKLKQRLSFSYVGEGKDRTITVSGHFLGEAEPREVDVTLGKVKTTNTQWDKQPDQQLMYHGCRVWARRHMPELMLGVYAGEEFDDQAAAVTNGSSIEHPLDYSDGMPERLTKPPEEKKYSRAQLAYKTHAANAAAMCHELEVCLGVVELDTTAIEIENRQEYKNLTDELKTIVTNAYANTFAALSDQQSETFVDFHEEDERALSAVSPPAAGGQPDSPHQPVAARVPLRKIGQ